MTRHRSTLVLFSLLCLTIALARAKIDAADVTDTRLLHQPATSGTHVAFVYADDLWVAKLDGSDLRRLTTDDGIEEHPAFSPDGTQIAFSAQYEGNTDVYVVPIAGGVPKRLTWHPGADLVQAFTPDGTGVLFTSPRAVFSTRFVQLFTVPLDGGMPAPLPIPNAARATYSPDGARIAYNPLSPAFEQWKLYRGGRVSRLWLYDTKTHAIERVPQPESRSNDTDPMWIGGTVYFRSDRNGEFNLFAYEGPDKPVRQVTTHADFPVLNASSGGGTIVYEQAGYLHLLDPRSGTSRRLTIGVPADLRETRPRYVKGADYVRDASLSPTGARALFEYRGEIVTVPAEKGDARNITRSTGAHDRSPAWSPDGTRIAYFSDEGGEYALYVASHDGKGDARKYKVDGAGFYFAPAWSPDGRRIAYRDNAYAIYVLDLNSGATKKLGAAAYYGPFSNIGYDWSPDSKWLAYTLETQPFVTMLSAYSVDRDRSYALTDGLSEVADPVFDPSGKYLYVFGSTDAGPVQDWFAQSATGLARTRNIYLVVLDEDLPSPLARESDEEGKKEKGDGERGKDEEDKKAEADKKAAGDKAPAAATTIDVEGIEYRILDLPVPSGELTALGVGTAGQVYYVRQTGERAALHRFDLNTRKDEPLIPEVSGYELSADGRKLLYAVRDSWFIVSPAQKINPGDGRINVADVEVRIEPPAEWRQIFDEAWRINRDYFYAPNMHGVDWEGMRTKYGAFLPHVATRSDLNRVIQWMMSELSVGHHRGSGGDRLEAPKTVPGGLLGADYAVEHGRYRFKQVYGGLNWNPNLRAPLTEPGVNVRAGDYLLAVRGQDLKPPTNLYSLFENTAGKIVEITVGPSPDGKNARTVQVVPIPGETPLRNRAWIEGNLKKVDAATGGRVAYVYVPNTAQPGYAYFKRYFYPQAHKDAVIVDERFNGGGQVADYYIDILRRRFISYWATRYGRDLPTPTAAIHGPKVMIIDETAGSGGDLLPWMFRKFDMGTLVGRPTWGGLVGILGFPTLMDGGGITAPNLAIWTPDEGWIVENEGVAPDVEVEQMPAEVIAGRDPQLEKAIEIVMEQLKKNPPPDPKRPPYPIKGKTLRGTVSR